MTSTSKIRHGGMSVPKVELRLEPVADPLPVTPHPASPVEDVERRLYHIRGTARGERVVATIRARSRGRAIEIATSNGVKVDRGELDND